MYVPPLVLIAALSSLTLKPFAVKSKISDVLPTASTLVKLK
jgi:hypothetical protein